MKPSQMTIPQLLAVLTEHAPVIDKHVGQELSRYLASVSALLSDRMIQLHSAEDMGPEFMRSLDYAIECAGDAADRMQRQHLANLN